MPLDSTWMRILFSIEVSLWALFMTEWVEFMLDLVLDNVFECFFCKSFLEIKLLKLLKLPVS